MSDVLQKALQHHRAGELPQAEQLYRTILETQPNHPDANHNLGVIAVTVNKPELALPFFKLALETNPNQAQFWLSYIDALIKTGAFDLARAVLIQGKESYGLQGAAVNALTNSLSSTNVDLYNVAVQLRESRRYLEAIDWLKNYLVQNPQDANAYAHLAQNFSLNKQDDDAWNALNSALALNPHSILVQRNHARLLLKQQKIQEARQIAAAIYQTDSSDAENQLVFAATLLGNDELEPAKKLCESALKLCPNYAEVFVNLGQISWSSGDKITALQLFEKALSIKPHLSQLYPIVAAFHNENKNLPAAIHALQKALEYEPHEVNHMINLGAFLQKSYQPYEAIDVLEKAVQLAPGNAMAWTNLGVVLQQSHQLKKAKVAYEKAFAIDQNQAEVLNNLGAIAKIENDWEAALEYLEKAFIIQPNRVSFIVNKAVALSNLGRYEESKNALLDALKIDPLFVNAHFALGDLFQNKNLLKEANVSYLKALEIQPDFEKASLFLARNYYLLLDYAATHEFFKRALPILNRPQLNEFKAEKNYISYIGKLLNWWGAEIKNTGLNFNEQNHCLPILAVIGESHSLAAHRTDFKQHRCHAYWLDGIKMWHLAQSKAHRMKQRMTQVLSELPPDMAVMFCIGEIDCRIDEGIWNAAKKQSEDCRVLAEKTVCGYINWLENALKNTAQRNIIIQGIPAPNYPFNEDKNLSNDIADFLKMIELVNQLLMFHTLAKGWQFLDVYAATALENGRSNQQWHLDGHHLSPSFYAQAHKWLKPF